MAILGFLSMMGAALIALFSKRTVPSNQMADTNSLVRLVGNLFVVMTSLLLGLMMASSKNTLDTNNRNIRMLATDIILLDRNLQALGPGAKDARRGLREYVQIALNEVNILEENPRAEEALNAVGVSLRQVQISDDQIIAIWNDARQLYREVVRQRWLTIDALGSTTPTPLIILIIFLLNIIFANFGFRAPHNAVVMATFLLAALLISATLFLIVEMDTPTSGMIEVSNASFQRALVQLQR